MVESSQSTSAPTFTVSLTESLDANSLVFTGTTSIGGTQSSPADTITFTGTGTQTFNGVTYATIVDGGYVFGIEQSNPINFGKGTPVLGLVESATPEPSTYFLSGLGFL